MDAVTLEGVVAGYGARRVLQRLDLHVGRGEVVGLVGPNGCGKTTALKVIAGTLRASAGTVRLCGADVATLTRRERARLVAVVPQDPALPVGYTARESTVMGRTPHLGFLQQEGPADYAAADEALARVGAAPLADRTVDQLSGGERQLIVLARALAQGSPVLLLDEPTAGLDIGRQESTLELVRRLARDEGKTVLAAIHELTLASLYCDRIAIVHDGRVAAAGPPSAVLTRENISRAYGSDVILLHHPDLPAPVVVPYSGGNPPPPGVGSGAP